VRRRAVVLAFVAVIVGLVVFVLVNEHALVRVAKRSREVPVVSSLAELERAREVMVGGVPVRLGVDTVTPALGGVVLAHAESRGSPPRSLAVRRRGASDWGLLRWGDNPDPGRLIDTTGIVIREAGEQVIEFLDDYRVVASVTVEPTTERFHPFLPVLARRPGPSLTFSIEPCALTPVVRGGQLHGMDSAGTSAPPTPFELPRFFGRDARPTLKLERTSSGTFGLVSSSVRFALFESGIECGLLARVWVNGVPYFPRVGSKSAWLQRESRGYGFEDFDVAVRVVFDALDGVHRGDRIGLQLFWSCGGSAPLDGEHAWFSGEGQGAGISNRIDFTLDAE
jgi:hypothetical protein